MPFQGMIKQIFKVIHKPYDQFQIAVIYFCLSVHPHVEETRMLS